MSSTGFGTWQFSDEVIPKVEELSALFHHQEYSVENFDPWGILFGSKDLPPLAQQKPSVTEWSDDESDDEPEERHSEIQRANLQLPIPGPKQQMIVVQTNNEQGSLPLKALSTLGLHESQLDELSQVSHSQETFVDVQASIEADGIAELAELLESGASETDLTTLPTAVVIEVFHGLADKGLCHAVKAVCAMKPTDQARFNSVIVLHLLLPRLQKSDVRCTRQVMSAFSQFMSSCPVLSCQQLLAPLIASTPPQHMDTVKHLLMQIKHQPQKDLILKAVLETLATLQEPHLALFLLLIGPSENNQLKQQLVKILSDSADNFPRDLQFGKLLLRVIPLVSTLSHLKEQLIDVVSRHDSIVKSNALKLLHT